MKSQRNKQKNIAFFKDETEVQIYVKQLKKKTNSNRGLTQLIPR